MSLLSAELPRSPRTRPTVPAESAEPTGPRGPFGIPDPPLTDGRARIVLRPWTGSLADVDALVTAWADPTIAATGGVPADVSAVGAARWIEGEPARRAVGACLDLVIAAYDDPATVLGEVGLRNIDRQRRRAEISWWVLPTHRGRGLATAAARLLADWAVSPAGGLDQVWARIAATNAASARVAGAAGLAALGTAGGTVVWSRVRPDRARDGRPD